MSAVYCSTTQPRSLLMSTLKGTIRMMLFLAISMAGPRGRADEKLEKQRCPRPDEIALVFSNGYGSGTYRTIGIGHIPNADILGYYDFHWKRGIGQHFSHLLTFSNLARENDAGYYSWLSATSGQAGKGNFNRNLYSVNTGMACGLKG